jgi:3D-(3,5/4)-trihydroxycyclohexane-1,2-dione acylhydrolase (decyclizing)
MKRLGTYTYGDNFEPIIKNRDLRTIPEFTALHGGGLTQTAASDCY